MYIIYIYMYNMRSLSEQVTLETPDASAGHTVNVALRALVFVFLAG